jgi:hypothetical protein
LTWHCTVTKSGHCGVLIENDLLPRELLQGDIMVAIWMNGRPVPLLSSEAPPRNPTFDGRRPKKSLLEQEVARTQSSRHHSILVERPLKGDYSLAIVNPPFLTP